MRRFTLPLLLGVAVVAALVVADPWALLPTPEPESGSAVRVTAVAATADLTSTFEAESGNIVVVDVRPVVDPQPGLVGWIADAGRSLSAGEPIYDRDLQPVAFLIGDLPAWRTMADGDVGPDVAQLESNLLALGYGSESDFTVDDTFTWATGIVVERWQADLGLDPTGKVAVGDVVFGPAGTMVGSVSAAVGDPTQGSTVLTLTSTGREIRFTVGAEVGMYLSTGTAVTARLPDGTAIEGLVTDVSPAGSGVLQVTAEPSTVDALLPAGDSVPVTVTWSQVLSEGATTVPADALLRLDSGSYSVQVVDDSGTVELVGVEPGERFGTEVEILSGLEAGTTVVTP